MRKSFAVAFVSRITAQSDMHSLYLHTLTVWYFTCSHTGPPEIIFVLALSCQILKCAIHSSHRWWIIFFLLLMESEPGCTILYYIVIKHLHFTLLLTSGHHECSHTEDSGLRFLDPISTCQPHQQRNSHTSSRVSYSHLNMYLICLNQ